MLDNNDRLFLCTLFILLILHNGCQFFGVEQRLKRIEAQTTSMELEHDRQNNH